MPIFTQSLRKIDPSNPQEAVKIMYNHLKYVIEQLEYTLYNLDSENIIEIDTDSTNITDATGNTSIGSYISLKGASGETFNAGKNSSGQFEFSVEGKGGTQAMYLNSSGEIVITKHSLTIDGGKW